MEEDKEKGSPELLPKRQEEHVVCICLLELEKVDKIARWRMEDGWPRRQCQMSVGMNWLRSDVLVHLWDTTDGAERMG
ncbi:hypothetical protein AAC387_Pa06g2334 [Persea americana]